MDSKTQWLAIASTEATVISIALILVDGMNAYLFATGVLTFLGTMGGYLFGRNGRKSEKI